MNVFVLCTGRSGSLTFSRACAHIHNYTAAHESLASEPTYRFRYPANHIEVDHRLSWFLGTLDHKYGDKATYVHLRRDPEKTARSWASKTNKGGQMRTWESVVLYKPEVDRLAAARLMVQTVTDNITLFLKDKTRKVEVWIEDPNDAFDMFWDMIGATGHKELAYRELGTMHNRRVS